MQLTVRRRVMTLQIRATNRGQVEWDQQVEPEPGADATVRIFGGRVEPDRQQTQTCQSDVRT